MMNAMVYYEDVDKLSEDEYIMLRKKTFGASDVSSLFGVGFIDLEALITQKNSPVVTDEERKIGLLPNVRKGRDLEPLIFTKSMEILGIDLTHVRKPKDMYQAITGLTINFDAVYSPLKDNPNYELPIELKYVSIFGDKYWKFNTANQVHDIGYDSPLQQLIKNDSSNGQKHVMIAADLYGMPPYYYTQIQTQIFAAGTEVGYLCALRDKDWNVYIWRVYKDPYFAFMLTKLINEHSPKLPYDTNMTMSKTPVIPATDF